GSMGNQVAKYPNKTVKLKKAGKSTLAGRKLWFDDKFGRLNTEEKGEYLGSFEDEKIIIFYKDGTYELTDTEITQRFEPDQVMLIEQFNPGKVITAVYLDQDKNQYNIKRFKIETSTLKTQFLFIKEGAGNRLEAVTTEDEPILVVQTGRGQQVRKAKFKVAKMVEVMGWKAVGAKLTDYSKTIEMEWEQAAPKDAAPELF
ncbi:MAG: DNA gyrase/topoisomerase IV subunit A, partial [Sphingobacteriia bacterium]|nr:DNA gyrase/topoisomerase IV subunit A [Sphingobacteriia bacterium]